MLCVMLHVMLCYDTLYVTLCYMLRYVMMLCYDTLCYDMLCYIILHYIIFYNAVMERSFTDGGDEGSRGLPHSPHNSMPLERILSRGSSITTSLLTECLDDCNRM
jgi:hypothetical protein